VNFTKRIPNLPFNALLLPVVLWFAFLLVLLLKLLTAVRTMAANGIPEMPGSPASARGTPTQLHR
jgi:hypothetical protein